MNVPTVLTEFAGTWSLERTIMDRSGGPDGRFEGSAQFLPTEDGLAYEESGHLRLGKAAPFYATRRYLWRADGSSILTFFDDGRPFHRIALGGTQSRDLHDCPPDTYRVFYDFSRWPAWQARWDVIGPRKDYLMATTYRRT